MTMYNTTDHTYTGGEHYWISFIKGQHEVRMEQFYKPNETVYRGTYEGCRKFLNDLCVENADYDLNI